MKKVLILALIIVLVFCFSACAVTENDDSGSSSSSSDSHEHAFSPDETVEPTCEEKGYTVYTCICGETYTEEIDALGHTFTSEVILQPTCSEPGVVANYCICGYSFYEPIDTTEHTWGVWYTVEEPTYTTTGQEKHICEICNTSETRDLPTNTIEKEIKRFATLASMLPMFESVDELNANHELFNWVRFQAGTVSSEFNEDTYEVTNVYSLDKFDEVTKTYLGRTFDFAAFAATQENMSIDADKNQLTWVTGGMGGWTLTALDSYMQVNDTYYTVFYYDYYEENVPVGYGTLNIKFTGEGFVIESHTD